VSPELVDLLRSLPEPDPPCDEDRFGFRSPRGILLGLVLGLAMWLGLFWLMETLLR